MRPRLRLLVRLAAIGGLAAAGGCWCPPGGGGGGTTTTVSSIPVTFTIGGSVSGLQQSGLTIQNNGTDTLPVTSGSPSFTFPTSLAAGSPYNVTISTQPPGQQCLITNGSGTANANVTNVQITCGSD